MDYKSLEKKLSKKIKHAKVFVIGKSVLNREIYAVEFDFNSAYSVIIQGAIHAREHITCDLICKMIEDVSVNFNKYETINTPNIIFVPMVNPDGVEICYYGLKSVKDKDKKQFLKALNSSNNFKLFKANANSVDLNTNFDAKWGSGEQNKFKPSMSDYVGEMPMSEPEVQALARLTQVVKPCFTISYHSKGQEIYYDFFNKIEHIKTDKKIAKMFARSLRYRIKSVQNQSCGGYKDWCIYRHHIPSLTIEVGDNNLIHPIGINELEKIYKRNRNVVKLLSRVTKEIEKNERTFYESCN